MFPCRSATATIAGIAKGAGMIEPNMATMLVYLMTDAELPKAAMKPMLKRVVDRTFNCMSIDTDTSTSDTVVLMANGLAGKVEVCRNLKKACSRSANISPARSRATAKASTKLITVDVSGAKTAAQAKRVAKLVVNSPLVKTAVYGCDPNWGRVIMAVGKSFDPSIEPAKVTIRFGATECFQKRLAGRLRSRSAAAISQPTGSLHRRRSRHRQSLGARLGLRFDRRLR